jgi:tryptophanyl-tRNA synthetase
LRTRFQQDGDGEALESARALLADTQNLAQGDLARLFAFLENKGKVILPEAEALLTETSKLPGLDGDKMSKSYGNTITLRESVDGITKKVRGMPTDPARVRRTDAGSPDKCPVWQFHQVYSDLTVRNWVQTGCTTAGIGCLECKQPIIDSILKEQQPMFERAQVYLDDPKLVKAIVADGCEKAQKIASATMEDVREAMGLGY